MSEPLQTPDDKNKLIAEKLQPDGGWMYGTHGPGRTWVQPVNLADKKYTLDLVEALRSWVVKHRTVATNGYKGFLWRIGIQLRALANPDVEMSATKVAERVRDIIFEAIAGKEGG